MLLTHRYGVCAQGYTGKIFIYGHRILSRVIETLPLEHRMDGVFAPFALDRDLVILPPPGGGIEWDED